MNLLPIWKVSTYEWYKFCGLDKATFEFYFVTSVLVSIMDKNFYQHIFIKSN